jgi:hypothetical protein
MHGKAPDKRMIQRFLTELKSKSGEAEGKSAEEKK